MLFNIDRYEYIKEIPYADNFRRWRGRLTDDEFGAIRDELLSRIDGGDIHTSSWIPGNDWSGTVYEPIYTKACDLDPVESGKCFGLFLWVVLQDHPDTWSFGRYQKNGIPISGLTYFRLDNPPPRP